MGERRVLKDERFMSALKDERGIPALKDVRWGF
jgi:hypothetical protein